MLEINVSISNLMVAQRCAVSTVATPHTIIFCNVYERVKLACPSLFSLF